MNNYMETDWTKLVDEDIQTHKEINAKIILDKYYEHIPGPNRDAKLKRIKRYLNKVKDNKPKAEKYLLESSIIDANEINLNIKPNKQITFGLISDTHFNSKYAQITYLNNFYDICKEQGITNIYHCGDIDDGEQMRPGHVYENYKQGADEHLNEIINLYPKRKGIITHFITGNHDASFRKSCGLDIGNYIINKRSDMNYLGRDVANINITDKITVQLRHPWSGSAYALSYRPQKIVESMEAACLDKPSILCIGHFHKMEYLYYHGVHVFQTGCFQSATPFTVGKGISVAMGGWIVTLEIDNEGKLKTITPKAVTFDKAIKDDYKNFII